MSVLLTVGLISYIVITLVVFAILVKFYHDMNEGDSYFVEYSGLLLFSCLWIPFMLGLLMLYIFSIPN